VKGEALKEMPAMSAMAITLITTPTKVIYPNSCRFSQVFATSTALSAMLKPLTTIPAKVIHPNSCRFSQVFATNTAKSAMVKLLMPIAVIDFDSFHATAVAAPARSAELFVTLLALVVFLLILLP
jgi:hypothetical protein